MTRSLAGLLLILFVPAAVFGGTNTSNVPLYGFPLNGTKKQTEEIPKHGTLEINRLVGGSIPHVDDGYAAAMTVHFMATFRGAMIPDNYALIGVLQPDGRLGAVSLLSAKVLLLIPYSQKIFIPAGQLSTLDPTVTNILQQRQVTVEEVETVGQAYQRMVRTR